MSRVELHHGAATDVGLVREVNEDAYLVAPPVFVVADGMGGHDRGDVASRIVVEEFRRLAETGYPAHSGSEVIAATLRAAQERIGAYDDDRRAEGAADFSAGTTAVVALLVEQDGAPRWLLANLGDSRIYRCSGGDLDQVSVDHSVVQELISAGALRPEDAERHPERHIVTRALGGTGAIEADYYLLPLASAERLLLCTDGVSGMVSDEVLATILAGAPDPRDAADRVVAAAVAAGGRDNATAVVIDVVGWSADDGYDSDASRRSLQEKLGALP